MSSHQQQNHFELFGLPVAFELDMRQLDLSFRRLQSEVHPDRFANGSPAERLQSIQSATRVNEAYQTLKDPTARGRYMLQLQGVESHEQSNTAMPPDFLMLQMELREGIEQAREEGDITALEHLMQNIRQQARELQQGLQLALDVKQDLRAAAETVRKLSFMDKLRIDIEQTITKLED